MKLFQWIEGRQKTGYWKLPLIRFWPPWFDLYLLKYPTGSYIKPHLDIVKGFNHYRLNIILKNAEEGGSFICEGAAIFRCGRFVLFRPDKNIHALTEVRKGMRYVLSIGLAIK